MGNGGGEFASCNGKKSSVSNARNQSGCERFATYPWKDLDQEDEGSA